MLLALAVVLGTTAVIGNTAKSKARKSLEDQIKRHLTDASVEAAATIGERFRRLQYGVLDVSAFALRDALQEVSFMAVSVDLFPLYSVSVCSCVSLYIPIFDEAALMHMPHQEKYFYHTCTTAVCAFIVAVAVVETPKLRNKQVIRELAQRYHDAASAARTALKKVSISH